MVLIFSASGSQLHDRSRELSGNIQRFASDFVRAYQTEDFREQHRFFADSVYFYRDGDLSLAGVEAATRRYRRDQQSLHFGDRSHCKLSSSIARDPRLDIGPLDLSPNPGEVAAQK